LLDATSSKYDDRFWVAGWRIDREKTMTWQAAAALAAALEGWLRVLCHEYLAQSCIHDACNADVISMPPAL
jgi:hypothetical protein